VNAVKVVAGVLLVKSQTMKKFWKRVIKFWRHTWKFWKQTIRVAIQRITGAARALVSGTLKALLTPSSEDASRLQSKR
jgi:hypothetical protein